jgi:hypothetical protein
MLFSEGVNMPTATDLEEPISISAADAEPLCISAASGLSVFVVFTSNNWTLKALEKAHEVARPLGAAIAVIALQVVPFPLPLDEPPIPIEFMVRHLEEKSSEFSEKIVVSAYLCRDPLAALKNILTPDCPAVMSIRKKWWPNRDERLAGKLRRAGYEIILVETE